MIPDSYRSQKLGKLLAIALLATACAAPSLSAQTTEPEKEEATEKKPDDKVVQLAPFQVNTTQDRGYAASSSLAGSRLNTELRNVASAIQVVTPEFLKDTGSTDLQRLLVYTTNTEVAGIGGNFYGTNADDLSYRTQVLVNPQTGTRVRGLNNADLTRDFFTTNIPMDAYN